MGIKQKLRRMRVKLGFRLIGTTEETFNRTIQLAGNTAEAANKANAEVIANNRELVEKIEELLATIDAYKDVLLRTIAEELIRYMSSGNPLVFYLETAKKFTLYPPDVQQKITEMAEKMVQETIDEEKK